MFDFFNTKEQLSRRMRKLIAPREDFKAQTKMAFLAVFDAAHPQARTAHSITALAKSLIAGGALLSIFAGMSVYADTANVAADSTFYPLKRLSENVQLALTPSVEKPQLQATFAVRRATEINDLATRKPSSTIIVRLNKDLDNDVDNSINAAAATKLSDGMLNNFCGTVFSVIATSSASSHGKFAVHSRALARFEGECTASGTVITGNTTGTQVDDNGDDDASGTDGAMIFKIHNAFSHLFSGATTTTADNASSSDEANVTSTFDRTSTTFRVRGGGLLNIIFDNPGSDASSTATTTIDIKKGKNVRQHGKGRN